MTISIPSNEPAEIRIGDTWQWGREDLADFPAPTWTLTYYFRNATHYFDVVAAAAGSNHAVTVAKATTATRVAGAYSWIAVATSATERREVDRGSITLLPDFAAAAVLDSRTFARKLLDSVEAALLGRATAGEIDVIEKTLADRGLKRSEGTLIALRSQLVAEVKREENAEAMRNGLQSKTRLMVRFGRA
jgi:hypothetical protein